MNVNLHPDLAFDLNYLGDLTQRIFTRMVHGPVVTTLNLRSGDCRFESLS